MWKPLLDWSQNHRHLPWRQERTLYRTLVSEIMLQQTTVATVQNHFERFLKRFPDILSLARASEEELLVAWKGLGYYRRAKNLKKIANAIAEKHGGQFPTELDDLMDIPGIGPYTANALISIGMDLPALAVDANLERVLARIYGIKGEKGTKFQKKLHGLFLDGEIVPERKISFRALNEALMDLGRVICQSRKASCEICPMAPKCQARLSGKPLAFPSLGEEVKKTASHELHLLRVVVEKGQEILAYQKREGQWLSGQWELPTFIISSTDQKMKQYPLLETKLKIQDLPTVKTGITKYNIHNYVLRLNSKEWEKWKFDADLQWRCKGDENHNLSTASVKCLAVTER